MKGDRHRISRRHLIRVQRISIFPILAILFSVIALGQESREQVPIEDLPLAKGFRFQSGSWGFSTNARGPMKASRGTLWANALPASLIYDPGITHAAEVRISVYKVWWKSGQDAAVTDEIVSGGEKRLFILDTAAGHDIDVIAWESHLSNSCPEGSLIEPLKPIKRRDFLDRRKCTDGSPTWWVPVGGFR